MQVEPRKRLSDVIRAVEESSLDMEVVMCGKFISLDKEAVEIVERKPKKYRLLGKTNQAET